MVKFGVAGNSDSFYEQGFSHTVESAKWCADREIDLFEYSFGRGVRMTEATARNIGMEFERYKVELSAHAPYYTNFASKEEDKLQLSINYVLKCLEVLNYFGTDRVVVHPASQGKVIREEALENTKKGLNQLADAVIASGQTDKKICLETMGKLGQMGTIKEIIDFCAIAPFFYPCVDFGHINAREQGILTSVDDFKKIFSILLDNMPIEKVNAMHIHFSKIEYGAKGEIRHLTFEDNQFGPDPHHLLDAICGLGLSPHIICESKGTQAEDAIFMKNYYKKLNLAQFS